MESGKFFSFAVFLVYGVVVEADNENAGQKCERKMNLRA